MKKILSIILLASLTLFAQSPLNIYEKNHLNSKIIAKISNNSGINILRCRGADRYNNVWCKVYYRSNKLGTFETKSTSISFHNITKRAGENYYMVNFEQKRINTFVLPKYKLLLPIKSGSNEKNYNFLTLKMNIINLTLLKELILVI